METNKPTARRFVVIGVNDDKDFCECCGKQGLKRVVWVEDTETQTVRHFGTTCATSPVKGFPKDEIKKAIGDFETLEALTWRAVHRECRRLGFKSGRIGENGETVDVPAETVAKRAQLYPVMRAQVLEINPHLAAKR